MKTQRYVAVFFNLYSKVWRTACDVHLTRGDRFFRFGDTLFIAIPDDLRINLDGAACSPRRLLNI